MNGGALALWIYKRPVLLGAAVQEFAPRAWLARLLGGIRRSKRHDRSSDGDSGDDVHVLRGAGGHRFATA
jgi:hypothetical protein